jgi:hypothetical protein
MPPKRRILLAGMLLASAFMSSTAVPVAASPVVPVGVNVPANQRLAIDQIDHAAWNALLAKYVDTNGMVDYTTWKATAADQQALDAYLAHLSQASLSQPASRDGQLAYWINAYNAVTVRGILREYPTTSIRNHTAKLFGYNIWKDLQLVVDGKQFSLEHIEHEILRKMGEPRIHFAIVCASIGCPRLLNEAYGADRLNDQLTANTQSFFADRTKFQYDAAKGTIAVSPIMSWFAEDFGANQAEQIRRVAAYLPDAAARQLAESGKARVSYLDYDWGINDKRAR